MSGLGGLFQDTWTCGFLDGTFIATMIFMVFRSWREK